MSDIYERIYLNMETIGVFGISHYAVLENSPYTPLCIDRLADNVYALAQNRVEHGAMIPDPDFEIMVDHAGKTAEPLVLYGPDGMKKVYPSQGRVDLKVKNELCDYLDKWLADLIRQGFIRRNL